MKIQNSKQSKKLMPAIIVAVVLLLVVAIALLFYFNRKSTQDLPKSDDNTNISHVSDNKQAQDLKDNPSNKQKTTNSDAPATPTNDTATGKQLVQMTSSYNISDGTFYIRGGINYPVVDGSCYATLSGPSGQSIRKDTTLLQNPASTDCKTIAIPLSELATGDWTFILHYTSTNFQGLSDEVAFSI